MPAMVELVRMTVFVIAIIGYFYFRKKIYKGIQIETNTLDKTLEQKTKDDKFISEMIKFSFFDIVFFFNLVFYSLLSVKYWILMMKY